MKTRTYFLAALTCAVLALPVGAQTSETTFKVKLFNGMEILSSTAPVASGSMLLVKSLSDGSLTAVPSELVSNVSKARTTGAAFATAFAAKTIKVKGVQTLSSARLVTVTNSETGAKSSVVVPVAQKLTGKLATAKMSTTLAGANVPAMLGTNRSKMSDSVSTSKTENGLTLSVEGAKSAMTLAAPLNPGQRVFLGPTGGRSAAATRIDTTVVSARGASLFAASPLGASIQDQIFVGDLPRMTPRSGLTAGMVAPTTGEVVIGPNGFPTPVTAATANGATAIGPNGFPDLTAGRTATPVVSPNGFPATGTAVSPTGLTRAGGSIPTGVPVTVTGATVTTNGSLGAPSTNGAATSGAAPAGASPR